jgi:hypothetical protein
MRQLHDDLEAVAAVVRALDPEWVSSVVIRLSPVESPKVEIERYARASDGTQVDVHETVRLGAS